MLNTLSSLFFPPSCMACNDQLLETRRLLCNGCMTAMPRLDPHDRCPICFQWLEGPVCTDCKNKCEGFRMAAVFHYESPAAAFIKQLKYQGREELAPAMAAWMLIHYHDLNFPWPDAIIPVPQSFPRRLVRGYNPSSQLAVALSKLMKVPLMQPLRRMWKAFPQAGKGAKERVKMSQDEFRLRSQTDLADKTLLLIDDVITTGTTIKRCSKTLQLAFPRKVCALGFCLA